MQIIPPRGLAADAIVPQCLDNQYTPDAVLDRMLSRRVGFFQQAIARLRLRETHTEFIRALLYSSMVVVNRAYLANSDYLVRELRRRDSAIPELIKETAIVPFLGLEKGLSDPAGFAQNKKSLEMLRRLEEKGILDEAYCVRLASDDDENRRQNQNLAANFRRFSKDLDSIAAEEDVLRPLAQQLFSQTASGVKSLGGEVPAPVLATFADHLREVCKYAQQRSPELEREKKGFGRQHIYERFFVVDGEKNPKHVAEGLFRTEMKQPALRMIKKLIDLKYNANLPDMLGRYTLTPATLPGRSALPYEGGAREPSHDEVLKRLVGLKREMMDRKPHVLPRLRSLNLAQVLEIRMLDEWEQFRRSQDELLRSSPDRILERFDGYQGHLRAFQKRLGRWALEYAPESVDRTNAYRTAVDLVLQFGLFVVFVAFGPGEDFANVGISGLTKKAFFELGKDKINEYLRSLGVTEMVEGVTVKLLVRAHNAVNLMFDSDHTYQLELMRSHARVHRSELVDILREVQEQSRVGEVGRLGTAEQSSQ